MSHITEDEKAVPILGRKPREPKHADLRRPYWFGDKKFYRKSGGTDVAVLDLTKGIDNVPANDFVEFTLTKTGTTTGGGTAATVTVNMLKPDGTAKTSAGAMLRGRLCNNGAFPVTTSGTTTIAAGTGCTLVDTHTADKDITITNVANASATGTLTVSGVVIDAQTVTIGPRTYQFRTGATALTAGNVDVDISARGTKAQGILTIAEPVSVGDAITIGDQSYVFVTGAADSPGEIGIGADEPATKVNIVAAINGTDGANTANTKVTASAFATDVCTLTARYTGTQGNSIVSAELGAQGLTHASNVFNATTLGTTTAGVDPTAAHAIIDLVAAITADESAVVTAVGDATTVVATAATPGTAGNSIATTETMANGAFGAATLTGGATGNEGQFIFTVTNSADETLTFRIGPPVIGQPVHGDYGASVQLVWAE